MKIHDQKIEFAMQHAAQQTQHRQTLKETFTNGQLTAKESQTEQHRSRQASASNVTSLNGQWQQHTLSAPKTEFFAPQKPSETAKNNQASPPKELPSALLKMIEVVEAMMERLTGKPYHLEIMGYQSTKPSTDTRENNPFNFANRSASQSPFFSGFNLQPLNQKGERITTLTDYQETETLTFKAQGQVTTQNGDTINFNFNSEMNRSFQTQASHTQESGLIFKDPLVVNFGGTPATLTLNKVQFDLDADGQQESMSWLNAGSGFLAWDRNQDGQINDGTELFGAQSGDGFADLQDWDEDGNGWIDENDSIFSQLQIWHKDTKGLDQLQGLLELNIGALYLQNTATPFTFKDPNNQTQGQVVSSGIFLNEQGGSGSLQQINLVV
ncbi:hypothetical protein [Thiosulfativibrio zosterae]|uniref:VCBS repeat-containing protein n=1 Tax=Thiosulfativibrio zosterae TaxID=2675053 RepID=A0A6F8PQH4_9GAMM|nr:hypothetical protein [Thiosulfativibrio zosterae]BBP44371.1 hypothetical protein THMIRHAT_21170 [Thiosulfativibrio zosterae]